MKPAFRTVLCVLCILSLLFTGCENPFSRRNRESVSSLVEYDPDTVYTEVPLPLPEDMSSGTDTWIAAETGMLCVYTADTGSRAAVYDWTGALTETYPLPENDLQYVRTFRPLSDGALLLFVNERETAESLFSNNALLITDTAGTVLRRYAFEELIPGPIHLAVSEDRIAMVCGEILHLFDRSLNLLASHTLPQTAVYLHAGAIGWTDEKTLYFHGGDSLVYTLYTDTGYLTPVLEKSYAYGLDGQQYSTHASYLLWEINTDGIWGLPRSGADSEEPVLHCSWAGSYLSRALTEILYIHTDGTVFCRSSNNIDGKPVYSLLLPKGDTTPKETVVIAAFRDSNTEFLKKLVSLFNGENDAYTVDLRLYETALYPASMEDASKELFGFLHAGDVPDLLMLNSYSEALYRNLENQGYLADLNAFSSVLTASAAAASRYKDTLTRLPLLIRYETLLTHHDTEPLTVAGLLAARDGLADGQVLFSAGISRKLTAAVQTAFVDPAAETCDFDTPSFLSYMELLRDLDILTDTTLGTLSIAAVDGSLNFQMTNSTLPDSLQTEKIRYLELPLWSVSSWLLAKLCCPDDNMYVCGYPDAAAMPSLDCMLVQFREGKTPAGAEAFLEYVLSDMVQTSSAVADFAFPVTSSALDTVLEPSWYTVMLDNRVTTDANGNRMENAFLDIQGVSAKEPEKINPDHRVVQFTAEDKAILRAIAENEAVSAVPDPTIETILAEELSVYLSGDRSAEDTARILQSRISMYLAE
ncbi:MAG: hypothetical protein IKV57_01015 [Clostridia bacterium]|nr:hypothetical protein [Clostridia bacterium]